MRLWHTILKILEPDEGETRRRGTAQRVRTDWKPDARPAALVTAIAQLPPVLNAEPGVRELRLALVAAAALTLRSGLHMLGIEAPLMRAESE